MFSNLTLGADGLSTYDGSLVHIPSVKVNKDIYSNVVLEYVDGITFRLQGAGEKKETEEPASALFDGNKLIIRNIVVDSGHYSNIELKYEGDVLFTLLSSNTPKPIFENSSLNRESDVWVDYAELNIDLAVSYLDIDNDGDDDIFVARIWYPIYEVDYTLNNVVPQLGEFYRNNNGSFTLDKSIVINEMPSFVHPRKAITAELNGDSYPDLVIVDHGFDVNPFPGAYIHLILSNIDGTYSAKNIDIQAFHHGVAAGDLDNDGDIDLFTSTGIGIINLGENEFDIIEKYKNITLAGVFTVEIYDLNNDGFNEIITSGHTWETRTRIYMGDKSASYSEFIEIENPTPSFGVTVDIGIEDLDNDGKKELVFSMTGGPDNFYEGAQIMTVTLDENNYPIKMDTLYSSETDKWIPWLKFIDVNRDGLLDIVNDDKDINFTLINQGKESLHPYKND